ncbi:hypothetical protein OROMI_011087 [Orobanche minor]
MEKNNLENVELGSVPKMGMTFESDRDAYDYYNSYARDVGFSIRKHQVYIRKSDKKLMWREIVCSCEGEREKHSDGTPKKARPQTRFNCKAQMRYEFDEPSGKYVVTVFVVQHSHVLAPPDKAYMLRSHRKICPAQASLINSMADDGIGPSDIYHYCAQERGSYDKLNFTHADIDNMVQRKRIEFLKKVIFGAMQNLELIMNALVLEKYELQDEDEKWLQRLFEKKEKWAQVYGRQHFCGGMASTQRSESMNNYFKKYFKRKQIFAEFMKHFDKALSLCRVKEEQAYLKSSQSVPDLESKWVVERLAREFYTRKMFILFQKELKASVDLGVNNPPESDVVTYDVEFFVTQRVHRVEFMRSANTTRCSCHMIEFTGLPCAHMLKVWRINKVESIPSEYFLARWSKAANPNIVIGTSGNTMEVTSDVPLSKRFNELSHMAQTLITNGSMSEKLAEVAKKWLKRAIEEVEACRKTMQDDTREPTDSNTENPRPDFLDNITICAPPRKKLKGQSGKRIKGFYDDKKKNEARQRKTNTGKNARDDLGKGERNTQPTKRRPREKDAEIKGKEDESNKGDIVEETPLENSSIQNNGVKMTSQYQLQRFTYGMEGYGVVDDMLGNHSYSQVPFSFQQLLADQCATARDQCPTARKLNFPNHM